MALLQGDYYLILAAICAIFGVVSIYLRVFRKNEYGNKKLFVTVVIILSLIGASSPFIAGYGWILRNREITAMKGKLVPPDININESFEINFGSNYIIALINELREGIELSRYIGVGYNNETYKYPISIDIVNNKLLVSAVIRNKEGEVVAKIKNNYWVVDPNPVLIYDRNYNDFALEVIDSDQNPVLQVIVKEQNKIYIGGIFYTPRDTILVTPNGFFLNPQSIETTDLDRIFIYPSEKNLHKMR